MLNKLSSRKSKPVYLSFLFICLSCGLQIFASEIKYPASTIPDSLKIGANAVKRMEEVMVNLSSTKDVQIIHHYAITVLNENGDREAQFSEGYDRFRVITSIEGALYDKNGQLIRRVKGKDFADVSAVDDISLMDDNRLRKHAFYYSNYPYTVEYSVTIRSSQSFSLPVWVPLSGYQISVAASRLIVLVPPAYQLRYQSSFGVEPVRSSEKNKDVYTWQVSGLPALQKQFASPLWEELTTVVRLAPSAFEIGGFQGSMSNWDEFGRFIHKLNTGRDKLPEHGVQKIIDLTQNATTEREKVERIYQYLQQNTRYISIQLGIGGWQPFEALFVAQRGYGDCKALTNYMYSLLKAVNIPSHYALIRAGENERAVAEDFPANQFNHAILCVPLASDTLWLECTSQTSPAGYMGSFTGNRKALLITENGGVFAATPSYDYQKNLQIRKIKGTVQQSGTLTMKVNTVYSCTQQEQISQLIQYRSKEKIEKLLQQGLELGTYHVNDFHYTENKSRHPSITEELQVEVKDYITVTGKRLFLIPNILNRSTLRISNEADRIVDLLFHSAYKDEDSVEIVIPAGYTLESAPADVSLQTKYGKYIVTYKVEENVVTYTRIIERLPGRFPATEQPLIAKFFSAIYNADRGKMVFVRNE